MSFDNLQEEILHIFLFFNTQWVLYALLLLSVLSLAVAFERFWYYRKIRAPQGFLEKIATALNQEDLCLLQDLRKQYQQHPSYATQLLSTGLDGLSQGQCFVEQYCQALALQYRLKMDRGLIFLGTLGNNAPFIGLFGTVLGIIRAFEDLSTQRAGASQAVMAGIAESLVCTAIGLLVALPAVALYNTLQRQVRVEMTLLETLSHMLLAYSKKNPKDDLSTHH